MQIPRRKSELLRKVDRGPIHLTEEAHERLKKRLIELKAALPAFIEEAARTAAFGDRSDNAEYKEAKGILRRTHRQIFSIEDQLKRVVIIQRGTSASGKIQIGSSVTVESDGTNRTFEILGSHETNPTRGRISFKSPLGAALIGHKKGDEIIIQTPSGAKTYRVTHVA